MRPTDLIHSRDLRKIVNKQKSIRGQEPVEIDFGVVSEHFVSRLCLIIRTKSEGGGSSNEGASPFHGGIVPLLFANHRNLGGGRRTERTSGACLMSSKWDLIRPGDRIFSPDNVKLSPPSFVPFLVLPLSAISHFPAGFFAPLISRPPRSI